VTDDLLPRLREHKPVLLAILDGPGLWTPAERDRTQRAGLAEADVPPLVTEARAALADLGAELENIETPESREGIHWAQRASALIASLGDDEHRVRARDWFEERAAICEYHGNLPRREAERIAYQELHQFFS